MENVVLLRNEAVSRQKAEIRFYLGEIVDSGLLTLTNFRLLWISAKESREISLRDIVKIESFAGFFNISSPKIILDVIKIQQKTVETLKDWECGVCNKINQGNNDKCLECGVWNRREEFKNDGKVCEKCTFINQSKDVCEICGNSLLVNVDTIQVKLSFRQGGMMDFLVDLQKYWNKKDWENLNSPSKGGVGGVSTVLDRINEAKIKVCMLKVI